MKKTIATALFSLVFAIFAIEVTAQDMVTITWKIGDNQVEENCAVTKDDGWDLGGKRTMVSVKVPQHMGIVVYRDSKIVEAVSFQNSERKINVEVDKVKVVDKFPSKEDVEKHLQESKWVGKYADSEHSMEMTLSFEGGKVSGLGSETYTLGDVGYGGNDSKAPAGTRFTDANGWIYRLEWITPEVFRMDGWKNEAAMMGKKRANPGQATGYYSLSK